jgi:hypothetical protein
MELLQGEGPFDVEGIIVGEVPLWWSEDRQKEGRSAGPFGLTTEYWKLFSELVQLD